MELLLLCTRNPQVMCIILSNSQRPWIVRCVNKFAPRLREIFHHRNFIIAYASEYSRSHAIDYMNNKLEAMRAIVSSTHPGLHDIEIVSIGDAQFEADACMLAASLLRRRWPHIQIRTKIIQVGPRPSLQRLIMALRDLYNVWGFVMALQMGFTFRSER